MRERRLLLFLPGLMIAFGGGFLAAALLFSAEELPWVTRGAWQKPNPSSGDLGVDHVPLLVAPGAFAQTPDLASPPQTGHHSKLFTWRDVEFTPYESYLQNLRTVGCPEDKVRQIALADIDQLIAQHRLEAALTHDPEWWRLDTSVVTAHALQTIGQALASKRQALIEKLLGEEVAFLQASAPILWQNVPLTGRELGQLAAEAHHQVQEICRRAAERKESSDAGLTDPDMAPRELARLRYRTRGELSEVMGAAALQEFLLRYSHNAHRLRDELRGFNPSAAEFRGIFGAVDPIDQQVELEFGTIEAMSPKQQERYMAQRRHAMRAVLSAERFADYLATQAPLSSSSHTSASR